MAAIDDILSRIKAIEAAVKDGGTIDMDKLKAEFAVELKSYVDAQVKEKLDSQPQRRVPGALIGPDGQAIPKSNRYYRALADFEKDGFHRVGTAKMKPLDLYLGYLLMDKAHEVMPDRYAAPSEDLGAAIKALSSTGTGSGAEFVPTNLASELWMDIFLASRIAGAIPTIPMPTSPFDLPLGLGALTWRKGTQNQATTTSDPATAKVTMTATELFTDQGWSYTMDEDSAIMLMPATRTELGRSGAEIIDDFCLNACNTNAATGNINSDDADPPDDSYFLSDGQNGIRHQHLVDNSGQSTSPGGALTDAQVSVTLGKQGKYSVSPSENVITCDVATYLNGFLTLTNVATVDKFGPNAVVLTGQLAAYRGIPIIPSAVYRLADTDGKVNAGAGVANNTKGGYSVFNRMMWYLGFRRELLIEVDRDIKKRQFIMVTSLRPAIAARGTRSTNTHTAGQFNVTV